MAECILCGGAHVVAYADVFRQPDGTSCVPWELGGIIPCPCTRPRLEDPHAGGDADRINGAPRTDPTAARSLTNRLWAVGDGHRR
jgi:hypothetical protein